MKYQISLVISFLLFHLHAQNYCPEKPKPPKNKVCYCENGDLDDNTIHTCHVDLAQECQACDEGYYLARSFHVPILDFCVPDGVDFSTFANDDYKCKCPNGQPDNGTAPYYIEGQPCGIDGANECQSCDDGFYLGGLGNEYCLPICQCENGVISRGVNEMKEKFPK